MFAPNSTPTPPTSYPLHPIDFNASTASNPSNHSNQSPAQSPPQRQNSVNAPSPHGLHARSCVTCRRRKVKCDKQHPCSNCNKAGGECVFPAPGRAPRRPRAGQKVVSEREAELLKRLRRLEGVVEELSGQVEIEAISHKHSPASDYSGGPAVGSKDNDGRHKETSTVRVVGMDEGSGKRGEWIQRTLRIGGGPPKTAFSLDEIQTGIGRLVLDEGKSRYVASPFWATISDEMEEIKGMLEDQEFESDSDAPVAPTSAITVPNHQSFIMGYSSSDVDLKPLHPLPSQIPFYWQTFLENVQPLVKLIHTPTMNKVIKEVQTNLDNLEKSTEALMFSIYFATITSMNASEVQTNFGVEKEILIRKYRFGVEQALAKAGFLNTNEIVTVQAFVQFLVCVRRHDDTKFVWSLTGLALRIAQSLGLHRDGTKFGLSPFDTEMRRRLWWQVCILDTRASEDHGSDPSILDYSYDTEFPLSVNDEDLYPEATEPPKLRPGVSEMTFCLIRYEICALTRKLTYVSPGPPTSKTPAMTLEEKELLVRDFSAHLEKTYLQYCVDAGPLYWVAATVSRLIVAKMSLIIYHPLTQPGKPNNLSQDIKDRLFMASIEIIEYSRILESEASTRQWGWLFHTYIQWHAIAYILGELCTRANSTIVERAWRAVDTVFAEWDGAVSHTKSGMLWQPMRRLMTRARRRREENKQQNNVDTGLGIAAKYMRPPPQAYHGIAPTSECARDRLMPQLTDTLPVQGERPASSSAPDAHPPNNSYIYESNNSQINNSLFDRPISSPFGRSEIANMGMMAPDQVEAQMMQQQMNGQQQQQHTPWLVDDNALADLDMGAEVNWEGWDDLVRDFQMEVDNGLPSGERIGPTFGGIGQWW